MTPRAAATFRDGFLASAIAHLAVRRGDLLARWPSDAHAGIGNMHATGLIALCCVIGKVV
jgi:hypothetical protein